MNLETRNNLKNTLLLLLLMCEITSCKPRTNVNNQVKSSGVTDKFAESLSVRLGILSRFSEGDASGGNVRALASSGDGFIAIAYKSGQLFIKDRSMQKTLARASFLSSGGEPGDGVVIDFRPTSDGKYFIAVGQTDGSIAFADWQRGSGRLEFLTSRKFHELPVARLDFSLESRLLVSGGEDGRIGLWNLSDKGLEISGDVNEFSNGAGVSPVAVTGLNFLSPTVILVGRGASVDVWSIKEKRLISRGDPVVSGADRITAVDLLSNATSPCFKGAGVVALGTDSGEITFQALSDEVLRAIDRDRNVALKQIPQVKNTSCLNESQDSSSISHHDLIKTYEAITANKAKGISSVKRVDGRHLAHQGSIVAVRFSNDGSHVLSASKDGVISLWNSRSFKLERQLGRNSGDSLRAVSLPRDYEEENILFSVEASDYTYRWNLARMNQPFEISREKVSAVGASEDGQVLVVSTVDRKLMLFKRSKISPVGNQISPVATISTEGPTTSIAVINKGENDAFIVAGHCKGWARVYRATNDRIVRVGDYGAETDCAGVKDTAVTVSFDLRRAFVFYDDPNGLVIKSYDFVKFGELSSHLIANKSNSLQRAVVPNLKPDPDWRWLPKVWYTKVTHGNEYYFGEQITKLSEMTVAEDAYLSKLEGGRTKTEALKDLQAVSVQTFNLENYAALLANGAMRVGKIGSPDDFFDLPMTFPRGKVKHEPIQSFAILSPDLVAGTVSSRGVLYWLSDHIDIDF